MYSCINYIYCILYKLHLYYSDNECTTLELLSIFNCLRSITVLLYSIVSLKSYKTKLKQSILSLFVGLAIKHSIVFLPNLKTK